VGGPRMDKPSNFCRPPEGVTADYPEFAIPLKTPQASFLKGRCSNC
jgi:hypothetical protein